MIVLTENNYKRLEKIPYVDNPKKEPDIVLYSEIFNQQTIQKMMEILNSLQFNKKGYIWLTDDPTLLSLSLNKNLTAHPFPQFIDKIREDIQKITGRTFNSCLVSNQLSLSGLDRILGHNLIFYRVYPPEKESEKSCKKVKIPKKIKLPYDLSRIYLNTKMRLAFVNKIRNSLSRIHSIPEGSQCFMKNGMNELAKYIKLGKLIGTGDWGNVYSACLINDFGCRRKFALKMSRITPEDFKDPYTETSSSWYEIWMLKDIIKPLIAKEVCPNLPLFIDTFLCDKCDFIFRKGDASHPCVITFMELASGDLRDYLKFATPSNAELYSALFQIMAGLHAIQMSGQILNNDIKSKNILYYDVKPGGYWHYKIGKKNFYVPNYGKMFVLNDFGVATLYDPNFQLYPNKKRKLFNLGSRFAINIDETFSPIEADIEYLNNGMHKTNKIKWIETKNGDVLNTTHGATYKIDRKTGQVIISHTMLTPLQKSYLFRKGITTNPKTWSFFEHPNIIPPFEFYNDVQDTLRTFVGGKRATQKGNHTLYNSVSKTVQDTIKPYLGRAENSKARTFSIHPYHVLAGSFITKFFTETVSYQRKPKGKKIGFYDMNKCLK